MKSFLLEQEQITQIQYYQVLKLIQYNQILKNLMMKIKILIIIMLIIFFL